jgi:hypothetical protein
MKTVDHAPPDKLLTFFLYILAGLEALFGAEQDHHPLRTDPLLARAWDQQELPYHTGVSVLLHALTAKNGHELRQALRQVSEPFIQRDIQAASAAGIVTIILDLTGEPVSDQSQSYPDTAYGYMDGTLEKGYQLAAVSLRGPQHRTFLAGFHHPGNTVSSQCLRELIPASEAWLGRPQRRPELVTIRIRALEQERARPLQRAQEQENRRQAAQERLQHCRQRLLDTEREWQDHEAQHHPTQPLAPTGRLSRLRQQRQNWQAMSQRAEEQIVRATRLAEEYRTTAARLAQQITELQEYQAQLEAENAQNPRPRPTRAIVDAGFATAAHITWLLEQGYEVEGKPHAPAVAPALHRHLGREPQVQVNQNTWMSEVGGYQMTGCPYSLRWALCCQKQGPRLRYEAMFSYRPGQRPTLRQWFHDYHQRADLEAGFKQGKGVFGLGVFHTRSQVGIQVQEMLVLFACNFVAWLKEWLLHYPPNAFLARVGVKELIHVTGQAEATVTLNGSGWLFCLDSKGPYAGQRLYVSRLPDQPQPTGRTMSGF